MEAFINKFYMFILYNVNICLGLKFKVGELLNKTNFSFFIILSVTLPCHKN